MGVDENKEDNKFQKTCFLIVIIIIGISVIFVFIIKQKEKYQNEIERIAKENDIQKMKYPYLIDTSMFCQHIDEQGVQYPANIGIIKK